MGREILTLLEGADWRAMEDHRYGTPRVGAFAIVDSQGAGATLYSAEEAERLAGALLSWAARGRLAERERAVDMPAAPDPARRAVQPDALYDVHQVARILSPPGEKPFHPDTVYRMGKRGVLPPTRVGPKHGRTLWRGRTLLKYLEESERPW